MSLTVVSATGLAKADLIGSSDPYALVLLNGQKVGNTRTLYNTQNPVWIEPGETFPLRMAGGKGRSSVVVQLWDEDLGELCDLENKGEGGRSARTVVCVLCCLPISSGQRFLSFGQ